MTEKDCLAVGSLNWVMIEDQIREVLSYHQAVLLESGRKIVPQLTPDDLLQPNDFPSLENSPSFRYDEGVVAGIQILATSLRARRMKEDK